MSRPDDFAVMLGSASEAGFSDTSGPGVQVLPCGAVVTQSDFSPHYDYDVKVQDLSGASSVETGSHAASDALVDPITAALLDGHDLLLQTVADYHHEGFYDPDTLTRAKIAIQGEVMPPRSVLVAWIPVQPASDTEILETWIDKTTTPRELLTRSIRTGNSFKGFLAPFWGFGDDRKAVYRVEFTVLDDAYEKPPLRAKVEIFPNDTFELALKIPPFRKITQQRSWSHNLRRETISSRSTHDAKDFGKNVESEKTTETRKAATDSKGETRLEAREHVTTSDGVQVKTTDTAGVEDGKNYYAFQEEETHRESGAHDRAISISHVKDAVATAEEKVQFSKQVSLKHNGVELDITKSINSLLSIAQNVKSAFDNFKEAVPKLGWSADIDFSLLEGTITGKWGIRPQRRPHHPRVWLVDRYYALEFDVKVIYLKASLAFGIDFTIENWLTDYPLLEAVAKVTGSLTMELPFKATVDSHAEATFDLQAATKPSLQVDVRASTLGFRFEGRATVACGIQFTGNFKCSLAEAPNFQGAIEWLPITITAIMEHSAADEVWKREIFRWPDHHIAPIWEGKFP